MINGVTLSMRYVYAVVKLGTIVINSNQVFNRYRGNFKIWYVNKSSSVHKNQKILQYYFSL
jgi:hypothetical protein